MTKQTMDSRSPLLPTEPEPGVRCALRVVFFGIVSGATAMGLTIAGFRAYDTEPYGAASNVLVDTAISLGTGLVALYFVK